MHWRRKWQPTPVFLPGESQGPGSLVAAVYGVAQSRTRLKRRSSSSSSAKFTILSAYWVVMLLRNVSLPCLNIHINIESWSEYTFASISYKLQNSICDQNKKWLYITRLKYVLNVLICSSQSQKLHSRLQISLGMLILFNKIPLHNFFVQMEFLGNIIF